MSRCHRCRGPAPTALGLLWLVVPLVLFLLDRPVLLAGHPAQLVALGSCALVGVLLIVLGRPRQGRTQPLRSSSAP